MNINNILFSAEGHAIAPDEISENIAHFKYTDATDRIIRNSVILDEDGAVFTKSAALILSNFGMTRSGPFKGVKISKNGNVKNSGILLNCWNVISEHVIKIHDSIMESGLSRDRYILELSQPKREEVSGEIWIIMKRLFPFTMGENTFGLVSASKILFSVLPEIVLPVDTSQWLRVFQTVDIGDVIKRMISDIEHWENITGKKLNEMDYSKRLTTLPSVYNVMAMAARPKRGNPKGVGK